MKTGILCQELDGNRGKHVALIVRRLRPHTEPAAATVPPAPESTARPYWGITEETFTNDRQQTRENGQHELVFHRPLAGGWRKEAISGTPLNNLHPKTRDLAVNPATLSHIQSDADYFRNLILDADTSAWERRPDWKKRAKATGWRPMSVANIRAARLQTSSKPLVKETSDYFLEEMRRMAATAMNTTANANGQTVTVRVRVKDTDFTRQELEEEIEMSKITAVLSLAINLARTKKTPI